MTHLKEARFTLIFQEAVKYLYHGTTIPNVEARTHTKQTLSPGIYGLAYYPSCLPFAALYRSKQNYGVWWQLVQSSTSL